MNSTVISTTVAILLSLQGAEAAGPSEHVQAWAQSVSVSADGGLVTFCYPDDTILLWDVRQGKALGSIRFPVGCRIGDGQVLRTAVLSPDGEFLLCYCANHARDHAVGNACVVRVRDGSVVRIYPYPEWTAMRAGTRDDGTWVIAFHRKEDQQIVLVNGVTGKVLDRLPFVHTRNTRGFDCDLDGGFILESRQYGRMNHRVFEEVVTIVESGETYVLEPMEEWCNLGDVNVADHGLLCVSCRRPRETGGGSYDVFTFDAVKRTSGPAFCGVLEIDPVIDRDSGQMLLPCFVDEPGNYGVFDLHSGTLQRRVSVGVVGAPGVLAKVHGTPLAVVASQSGRVIELNVETGEIQRRQTVLRPGRASDRVFVDDEPSFYWQMCRNPNSDRIAIACYERLESDFWQLGVWNLLTGEQEASWTDWRNGRIQGLKSDPSGSVCCAYFDGVFRGVRVLSLRDGSELARRSFDAIPAAFLNHGSEVLLEDINSKPARYTVWNRCTNEVRAWEPCSLWPDMHVEIVDADDECMLLALYDIEPQGWRIWPEREYVLWDVARGEPRWRKPCGSSYLIYRETLKKRDAILFQLFISDAEYMSFWDRRTGKELSRIPDLGGLVRGVSAAGDRMVVHVCESRSVLTCFDISDLSKPRTLWEVDIDELETEIVREMQRQGLPISQSLNLARLEVPAGFRKEDSVFSLMCVFDDFPDYAVAAVQLDSDSGKIVDVVPLRNLPCEFVE